jgi:hypothetical protein
VLGHDHNGEVGTMRWKFTIDHDEPNACGSDSCLGPGDFAGADLKLRSCQRERRHARFPKVLKSGSSVTVVRLTFISARN